MDRFGAPRRTPALLTRFDPLAYDRFISFLGK
jgi:hypothetical protein